MSDIFLNHQRANARPNLPSQIRVTPQDHSNRVHFQDASNRHYKTFGDAQIQSRLAGGPKGFGVDLDGDGQFNSGKDGYLQLNLGGRSDRENISRTNDMLKAFGGNFDLDGDGVINRSESQQARQYRQQAEQMDFNRDGVLSRFELQSAGAKVVRHGLGPTDAPFTEQVNLPGFGQSQPPYQPPFTQPNAHPFFQSFMKNLFSMFNSFFSPQPAPMYPVQRPLPGPGFRPFSDMPNAGFGRFG